MGTLIDIIGASIIGSILMLVSMHVMDSSMRDFVNHHADAIVQNDLTSMTGTIQQDLHKMGFGVPEVQQSSIIQVAQPNHLRYLSHLAPLDDVPDTIEYSLDAGDTVMFTDTSIVTYNITREIHRSTGGDESGVIGVVTNPTMFRFLDQLGNPVVLVQSTKMVEVTLVAMNPNVYMSDEVIQADSPEQRMTELRKLLKQAYWRQTRVISRNLRR